jgi:hypothetical protein
VWKGLIIKLTYKIDTFPGHPEAVLLAQEIMRLHPLSSNQLVEIRYLIVFTHRWSVLLVCH